MNCPKCGSPVMPNMKFCAKCGTPVSVQQPAQQANAPQMPVQQKVAVQQPKQKDKKEKKQKKNLPLIIVAIVLVIAVIASSIAVVPGIIKNKNEINSATEYIEDFPTLKQQTEFLVYDAEKFPSEKYEIKVERMLMGGVFRGETVIEDVSTEHIYNIDFKEDGDYRITLTDITAERTQATSELTESTSENSAEIIEIIIIIDVVVDDDDPEALDKVDVNSKPVDESDELPEENSKPSGLDFIKATDEDFEELKGTLSNLQPFLMQFEYSSTDADAYKTLLNELSQPFGDITFYYYIYGEQGDRVYINAYNANAKPDPLNKLGQCYEKYPADKLDWILENIFNVTPDRDNATVESEFGTELYYYDNYYYFSADDGGDICTNHLEIKEKKADENNVYTVTYSIVSSENVVLETYKAECAIKDIDGEKYWSIYKIEKYDPIAEQSQSQTESKNDIAIPQNVKVGDYIKFGKYEQDNNTANGKEDIEWRVLDIQGNKAFVISKYAHDSQPYNTVKADVTWETCSLRSWLNNDFYNAAFSDAEKSRIQTTTVSADYNPNYDKNPGNATQDKVYIMSVNEVTRYFASDDARLCMPTEYAKAQGVWFSESGYFKGRCSWWLRSPGAHLNCATSVRYDGFILHYGEEVQLDNNPVRPVMWITIG